MGERLLALHDSADFGGHERILIGLLPGVLEDARFASVVFYVPERNVRLQMALAELASPRFRVETWPFTKRRGEPYLHPFRLAYVREVRAIVSREQPTVALLVQGRIEHLAVPAATLPADMRVVSYLPMAHQMVDMGRSGALGDRFRRRLYRRPDMFIVPDQAIALQIAAAGGTAPVRVAENVVNPVATTKQEARALLNLPAGGRIALFLGRLEAGQKGIDLLLESIRRDAAQLAGTTILFVGDGPAAKEVGEMARSSSPASVHLVGWTDRPDLHLAAADILLMPSRWEGLPLVMLEAMTIRLPLLASPIDVFTAKLPPANLHDFSAPGLADAIVRVLEPGAVAAYAEKAEAVIGGRSLARSRAAFADALVERR